MLAPALLRIIADHSQHRRKHAEGRQHQQYITDRAKECRFGGDGRASMSWHILLRGNTRALMKGRYSFVMLLSPRQHHRVGLSPKARNPA
ncbi:MAG: hypothetical protein JOZ58_06850 [Acetobacteraceae bacterium]|nr:hypothetical protein [Acetobacteraceae bacterium]